MGAASTAAFAGGQNDYNNNYKKIPHCIPVNQNLPIHVYYPTGLHTIPFKDLPRPTLEGCDSVSGTAKYAKQIFEDNYQVIVSDWYRLNNDNDQDKDKDKDDNQCKSWQVTITDAYPGWGNYWTPNHTYCVTNTVYKKHKDIQSKGDKDAEYDAINHGKAQVIDASNDAN